MYENFMSKAMKKEQEKLEKEKKKIETKEQNHKKRLRHLRTHIICTWGASLESVFKKLDIVLSSDEIIGMTLDALTELEKTPEIRKSWAEKGYEFSAKNKKNREKEGTTLIISFTKKPATEILRKMKEHKFKYSSPFKMWYRKNPDEATKTKIEEALKESNAKLEVIGNFRENTRESSSHLGD